MADNKTLDILLKRAELDSQARAAGLKSEQADNKTLEGQDATDKSDGTGQQQGEPTAAQQRKLRWEAFKDTMAPDREITPEPEIDINKAFREGDIKSIQQWWEQGQTKPEEIKRREKRDRLIASIGDGLAAISNLVTASHGAPSAFDASKGVRAGVEEGIKRYDMDFAKDAGLRYKAKEKAAATFQALENRRIATENAIRAQEAAAELKAAELAARHAEGEANRANAKELAGIRNKGAEKRQKNAQNFKLFYNSKGNATVAIPIGDTIYHVPAATLKERVERGRLFNLIPEDERNRLGDRKYDFDTKQYYYEIKPDKMPEYIGMYLDSTPALQDAIKALAEFSEPRSSGKTGGFSNPNQKGTGKTVGLK